MKHLLLVAALNIVVNTTHATDFKSQVAPVLKQFCYKCHSELQKKEKGELVLDNVTRLAGKIGPNAIIKPGDPDGSSFYTAMTLPKSDEDHMPPAKETQPPAASIAIIKAWIAEGASLDGKMTAAVVTPPAVAHAVVGPVMTWTSADGKSIQASFVKLDGDNVVIKRADGVSFTLPLSRLSPESQAQARNAGKQP
jgi:hypothetical protein